MNSPPIGFVLWDGREISPSARVPVARVVFHDRATFWKVMLDPDLRFGEAYSDGRLDVAGDLVVFLEAIHRARAACGPYTWSAALLRGLHRGQANTLTAARQHPPPL